MLSNPTPLTTEQMYQEIAAQSEARINLQMETHKVQLAELADSYRTIIMLRGFVLVLILLLVICLIADHLPSLK